MSAARKPKAREILARNVRLYRAQRSWSQKELASRAGISQTYVSQIESAMRAVSLDVAERIAWALNISLAELVS